MNLDLQSKYLDIDLLENKHTRKIEADFVSWVMFFWNEDLIFPKIEMQVTFFMRKFDIQKHDVTYDCPPPAQNIFYSPFLLLFISWIFLMIDALNKLHNPTCTFRLCVRSLDPQNNVYV